jgi:hypothetical protein
MATQVAVGRALSPVHTFALMKTLSASNVDPQLKSKQAREKRNGAIFIALR